MNLALTEDQGMIRDAAQSFLADASGSAAVRAAMDSAQGFDQGMWARIGQELGWCAITIPESCGGLGLGAVELALILEQCGRYLLCAPYFSTVCLAANLLLHAGNAAARERLLPQLADGSRRATAPLPPEPDGWSRPAARAQRRDGRWVLGGAGLRMPDAVGADWLLVPAAVAEDDTVGLFAVAPDAAGLRVEPLDTWDRTRRLCRVSLDQAAAERCDAGDGGDGLVRGEALAQLAVAAEQLGGAQQCLDLTVAYTATRQQFGRTVASFQAVKHRCAEMMVRTEALRSAVYGAAAFAAGEPAAAALALECAAARALAADTFFYCAQEAIQLHGGVGFTWEYDPQLYFKRAQAGSRWFGSADQARERIACALLD